MKTMYKRLTCIAACLLAIGVLSTVQMTMPTYAQEADNKTTKTDDTKTDESNTGRAIIDRKLTTEEIGYKDFITSGDDALAKVLYLVYTWAGIIGVVVIIIAGYLFTTARGDPTQMKRSKDAVRGAVVGLVIVSIAFVITRFVIGRVQ